jgi:hypothetical protein
VRYRSSLRHRSSLAIVALTILRLLTISVARAEDVSNYPNWKGQWSLIFTAGMEGQVVKFDPTKPWGPGQEAPLTPEYQKVLEDSMADQAKGGLGNYPTATCHIGGMPRMMSVPGQYEFIIEPDTTYILMGTEDHTYRRIFTDGRAWPIDAEPTHSGVSIGKWIDENGGGRFNVLEAETRGPFRAPHAYDGTGLPLHADGQSTFKERFYLDQANPNILHDMITVFDHALTRPWTADKTYRRGSKPYPSWREDYCIDNNVNLVLGKENYWLSADGLLMPAKKNQAPPDLRYFRQSQNR